MKKAFGYLRVSTPGQVDGDGFPRQKAAIEAYAKAHDLKVVRYFEEEGVTGEAPGEQRPAWAAMWNALEANGTRTIIIERLDRLARVLMIQETLLGDLKKNGFEIISTAEPDLDSKDPTRVLIRQVMGAVAQYDKAMIVARMRGARDRNSQRLGRRVEGCKPFGALPGEAATFDRIHQAYAQDPNYHRVATRLNAEGCKPRGGKRWYAMTVRKILLRAQQ